MACFLVIDEDAAARRTLRELLSENAHDVVETAVGADARRCCRDLPIDVAFSSMHLPDLDGLELMRQLWAIRPAAKIVAMAGGGAAALDPLANAIRLGAVDFLTKPFCRTDVEPILEGLLNQWS